MSQSSWWRNLFSYQQTLMGSIKSKVYHQEFFIAPNGKSDPYQELQSYLQLLESGKKEAKIYGFVKDRLECAFPARYELVHRQWPDRYPLIPCPQFEQWRENFSLGEAYLVYSSAYPNNPASLFGHTLLRFDRARKGLSEKGRELLGYSVGFMAVTDPRDNPMLYTFKGITGQYLGSFQIRPHYVNVGIYNNGEARDLWEYHLAFSDEEKKYLEKLLYELSLGPGYPYYFFDDNCSYYLLLLLEMVRPTISFKTKERLVVLPHETLQEVVSTFSAPLTHYRPSLSKRVAFRLEQLTLPNLQQYLKGMDTATPLEQDDPIVIDLLVDGIKEKNYQAKANLRENDRKRMQEIMKKRASFDAPLFDDARLMPLNRDQAPHLAHKSHRLNMMANESYQQFNLGYGLHSPRDERRGFDGMSYIDYLELQLERHQNDKVKWSRFKLIEINALQPFKWYRPKLSWRIDASLFSDQSAISPSIESGVGVTFSHQKHFFSFFANIGDAYWAHHRTNGASVFSLSHLSLYLKKFALDYQWRWGIEFYDHHSIHSSLHQLMVKYHLTGNCGLFYRFDHVTGVRAKAINHLLGFSIHF